MSSQDISNENVEKIAALFPNCVTETAGGKAIDFDLLKQELNNEVIEGNKERYRLEWPGKREAIVTANLPTTKTLRPVREDSVDFDNTENLYIEGDNLEVLKLLQESYLGKIKMIYIDPPYNTGKDFVYKDNFNKDAQEELIESGQKDEYNQRLVANLETAGRYHSDWLSMMNPRLKLARNLLKDDGVIFISIDNNEVHNLMKICDEIFGEHNFIESAVVKKSNNGMGDKNGFATNHEYIVCYQKNKGAFYGLTPDDDYLSSFNKEDEFGQYKTDGILMKKGQGSRREDSPTLYFPIYYNPDSGKVYAKSGENLIEKFPIKSNGSDGRWTWSKKKIETDSYKLYASSGGTIYIKDYFTDERRMKIKSILEDVSYITDRATNELKKLFDKKIFDTPKPINLIKDLLDISTKNDDIVLDFFAGSATTAHSIFEFNTKKNQKRKFILVQIAEETDKKSEAYNAGYKNICEIGKERIRRAGKKIKEETAADIDYGFRVFRLDESNMQDVYYKPQDYKQGQLDLVADNVKSDRTADDLLAQVMLDWGLPLSLKIEQVDVFGKKLFKVAENSLFACFDTGIDEEFAKETAKESPLRIVFKDSAFKDDTAKVNVKQLLKQLSPETEMKVI